MCEALRHGLQKSERLATHVAEARAFIASTSDRLDLHAVVLDDWAGIRLVWETGDVRSCTGNCRDCPTFAVLGEDTKATARPGLNTTLRKSTPDHTSITGYGMLNCKTMDDYKASFVDWLLHRCQTEKDLSEELDLIGNFHLVHDRNARNGTELRHAEIRMKTDILRQASDRSTPEQARAIRRYVESRFPPSLHYFLAP